MKLFPKGFKIKKHKKRLEQALGGEDVEDEFLKDKDSHVENEVVTGEEINTAYAQAEEIDIDYSKVEPDTSKTSKSHPEPEKKPEDMSTSERKAMDEIQEHFHIGRDPKNDYDLYLGGMWHETTFDSLKTDDIFRIRFEGKVMPFYEHKELTPISLPYFNDQGLRVMIVKVIKTPS